VSAGLAIAFGVPQASEFQAAHHTFLIYVAVILVIICREAFSHSGATW
jgi:hypothetical protein